MIVQTMTAYDIANQLHQDDYNGFSYSACIALAEYLESYCDDIGATIEFDRVAIRCEWTQYTVEELAEHYRDTFHEHDHEGQIWEALHDGDEAEALRIMEWILSENTSVVRVSCHGEADTLLVQDF